MSSLLSIDNAQNIYLASDAVDFRKSIPGLASMIKDSFGCSAHDGSYFVFYNQNLTGLKIMTWDGDGFILVYKKLTDTRFKLNKDTKELNRYQLKELLCGNIAD